MDLDNHMEKMKNAFKKSGDHKDRYNVVRSKISARVQEFLIKRNLGVCLVSDFRSDIDWETVHVHKRFLAHLIAQAVRLLQNGAGSSDYLYLSTNV